MKARHQTGILFSVFSLFLLTNANAVEAHKCVYENFPGYSQWSNSAIISTNFGLIKGFSDKGSTWCWKGVPYAKPPVGDLRWKAPVDPDSWTDVRKTVKFASAASQLIPVLGQRGSEDCLYLNVWRPRTDETQLPVYVFIHGGGNSIGSGNSIDYNGNTVAGNSNMVYITVNYRLGVMGWFRHPAVTGAGTPEDQSGNFGTLDLIKALGWIHENIVIFGGDPGNVTIAGESGGAMDVLSLLSSPLAHGLFHRAVVESGLTLSYSKADAEVRSATLLNNLLIADGRATNIPEAEKIAGNMTRPETDSYLRSKSAGELMKRIPTIVGGMANWPSILSDGYVLPENGYGVFKSGTWANKVPILIGVNKDEMKLFRFLLKEPRPGTGEYEMLSHFQSLLWRVSGLDNVVVPMTSFSGMPPVFAYRFDWGTPDENGLSVLPKDLGSVLGANHYAEIPFFLNKNRNQLSVITGNTYSKANQPGRQKLKNLCVSYITNFARTGNPNAAGLPNWNPWNPAPGADKYLILDAGFNDLRISSGTDILSVATVVNQMKSELTEAELAGIMKWLAGPLPFGLSKQ